MSSDGAPLPDDLTWARLEDQIDWYDRRSGSNQRAFKRLKYVEIVAAAAVPVGAAAGAFAWLLAALGAAVLVLEGVQHVNQFQENWSAYRSTAEALKHEKYLYLAESGPYAVVDDPHSLLAERIEGLVSQEHATWVSAREQAAREDRPTNA